MVSFCGGGLVADQGSASGDQSFTFAGEKLRFEEREGAAKPAFEISGIAEALLNCIEEFVFISDPASGEIPYVNRPLQEYLKLSEPFLGTCYTLLRGRHKPCLGCKLRQNAASEITLIHNNLKTCLGDFMQVRSKRFSVNGRPYNMNTVRPAKEAAELTRDVLKQDRAGVLSQIVDILTTSLDSPDLQLKSALPLFGPLTGAERVYAFISVPRSNVRPAEDGLAYVCEGYWSAKDRTDITDITQDALSETVIRLGFSFTHEGIINKDSLPADPLLAPQLEKLGIRAVLAAPMFSRGRPIACIFAVNPDEERVKENTGIFRVLCGACNQAFLSLYRNSRIASQNNIDPLTKFRTRAALLKDLNTLFSYRSVCVLCLNINGLKTINQTYGFKEGDSVIVRVASVLEQLLPNGHSVYRTSGDEFLAVYSEVGQSEFRHIADMLKAFMSNERGFSAAVGACWVKSGAQVQSAINMAGADMLEEKKKYYHTVPADSRYRFTRDAMLDIISPVKISKLISDNCFMVYYQPKVYLRDGMEGTRISSAEALIRLRFNGAIITPNDFIPPLEASHYTHLIDFFVLKSICKKMRERLDQGLKIIPVSCNFSRHSAVRPDFVDSVLQLVRRYGIDPRRIIIEISERSQTFFKKELIRATEKLAGAGFQISVDDFGVAHANLWVLSDLPVSEVKFDKRLIDALLDEDNSKIRTILQSMNDMCHHMGIHTVAEGCEQESQDQDLRALGCDEIQGYYYSRPLPESDFFKLFDSGAVREAALGAKA